MFTGLVIDFTLHTFISISKSKVQLFITMNKQLLILYCENRPTGSRKELHSEVCFTGELGAVIGGHTFFFFFLMALHDQAIGDMEPCSCVGK